MLSPHTPPGTLVVCIGNYIDPYWETKIPKPAIGQTYTVHEIVPIALTDSPVKYGIKLLEFLSFHTQVFDLSHNRRWTLVYDPRSFRPAVLPACLTDLLKSELTPAGVPYANL